MKRPSEPPLQNPLVNEGGHVTLPWAMFFQRPEKQVIEDTLANIPTGLGPRHKGTEFYATDYKRRWIWNGTGWDRAPGEEPHHYIWCDENPGAGWALCNGSSVTRTNDDATTSSYTPKNLASGTYVKGGTVVSGPNFGSAPSATVDAVLDHTHAIDHDHGQTGVNGGGALGVTTGGVYAFADLSHDHDIPAHSGDSGAAGAHTHTLSWTAAGEPANYVLLPYYRL